MIVSFIFYGLFFSSKKMFNDKFWMKKVLKMKIHCRKQLTCSWHNCRSFGILAARVKNAWIFVGHNDVGFVEHFKERKCCMWPKSDVRLYWQAKIGFFGIAWTIDIIRCRYFGHGFFIEKLGEREKIFEFILNYALECHKRMKFHPDSPHIPWKNEPNHTRIHGREFIGGIK